MTHTETYTQPNQAKTLIFLQHDRTAGNATISVFEDEFGPAGLFKIGIRGDVTKTYQDFREAAAHDASRIYMGHFYFGIHQHIRGPSEYFTTLRNPVERVLSNFEAWGSAKVANIKEWLAIAPQANNGMVKRLCGIGELDGKPYDYIRDTIYNNSLYVNAEDLAQAIANIEEHIPLVLIHGHFEQNMLLLQHRYATGPFFSLNRQRNNHSPIPITQDLYTPELIEEITQRNTLDIQLYEKYKASYDQLISCQSSEFFEELRIMELISQIVSERGTQHMRDEDVLQRLTAVSNQLLQSNRTRDVIEILRRFSRKGNISAPFCQNVLGFFRQQATQEDIVSEVDNYRQRFGIDGFLNQFSHEVGIQLPQ